MSKVILLDTEAGSDSVANLIESGQVTRYDCSSFELFEKTYWALNYGQIKGDLVVVDTVSSIVNRFVLDTTLDPKDLNPQAGKTIWSLRDKMRQNQDIWNRVNYGMTYVLTGLRNLPIPTIFLIHERERDDPTLMEEGDAGKRNMPALPPKILLNVMAGSDVVLRMFRTPRPAASAMVRMSRLRTCAISCAITARSSRGPITASRPVVAATYEWSGFRPAANALGAGSSITYTAGVTASPAPTAAASTACHSSGYWSRVMGCAPASAATMLPAAYQVKMP